MIFATVCSDVVRDCPLCVPRVRGAPTPEHYPRSSESREAPPAGASLVTVVTASHPKSEHTNTDFWFTAYTSRWRIHY